MGDFNWVSPNFLAFASPQHKAPLAGQTKPHIPANEDEIRDSSLPTPFKNVLHHFYTRDIGLVVRLNSHLYPAEYFTELGMTHLDMIFDDGTCPPLSLVRKFINLAHQTITVCNKNIAVHCKAGLGRTGCLIGAYLVYRHGFTANEVIAYMRFMRPGMVVGPQQHWLHLNQDKIREWWFEDTILAPAVEKATQPASIRTPSKGKRVVGGTTTPTRRSILGEVDNNESGQAAALPAPTPGQPRKSSTRYTSGATSVRRVPAEMPNEDENVAVTSPIRRRKSAPRVDEEDLARALESGMSQEEYMVRLHRRTASKSPGPKPKRHSGSSFTSTTVSATVSHSVATVEKPTGRSGSGIGAKIRSSPRRGNVTSSGVRKVSSSRQVSGGSAATSGRAL
jgi:cell division cycle 14